MAEEQIISYWTDHSATWNRSRPVFLETGVSVNIRLELYEKGGDAVMEFYWSGPRMDEQIIPAACRPCPWTTTTSTPPSIARPSASSRRPRTGPPTGPTRWCFLSAAGQWRQWQIPPGEFAGANPARIRKITIGLGNKSQPAPGGAGRIYLDDIGVTKP